MSSLRSRTFFARSPDFPFRSRTDDLYQDSDVNCAGEPIANRERDVSATIAVRVTSVVTIFIHCYDEGRRSLCRY